MSKKILGLGVDDFKKVISSDYYYIDKTKFIEDIYLDGSKIKLFCRPRRFGKTLNLSMLKYFFDIKDNMENRNLFNGLYIQNSPIFNEQGKYPVIFISMKSLSALKWDIFLEELKIKLKSLYREFNFLTNHFDKYILSDYEFL